MVKPLEKTTTDMGGKVELRKLKFQLRKIRKRGDRIEIHCQE
jgi:hypothetical protein